VPDDRHHAVDALVLAATTESLLQALTRAVQKREREGRQDDIFHCGQPWPGFRVDVERAVRGENGSGGVFVSRAERRRARGKAHDATIRQVRGADGKKLINMKPHEINGEKIVYERKDITDKKFKEDDLKNIPVPTPYGKVTDPKKLRDEMVESLRAWIRKGKPKDDPPRSPSGDIIRKVRIATDKKVAIELSGGAVDRGDMARVDVFKKSNKKGKIGYYLVPIYPHQVANPQKWPDPPKQAIVAHKEEDEWTIVDDTFEFLFSLSIHDYIEVAKSDGVSIDGYYKGVDRAGAQITVAEHNDLQSQTRGIGSKTLFSFKKFTIDRLGRKFEVSREVRTWRGKACT
jgi:CRISPR-associated endonuclease Csn1